MNKQIEDKISKCSICNEYQNKNIREPMIPHEIPNLPWYKVATDLFEINKDVYLLIVDYYSNFFEISKLPDTRSQTVISYMKSHFARYIIPLIVISDNGPQFSSKEFAEFAKKYQFKHITSSPYHPQSNGLAERSVQTAKKLLKKAQADHADPYLALLAHRNTPTNEMLGSPAQRLMSRRTRTILPASEELLKPQVVKNVKENQPRKN
ncbi:uncharacterized protein K02A2.6-like [Stegodyphus dumicola]|uniref:uncharacterized protein K02A2.6-like n=1 Tax=Stegodyphus dumicola TaxID=202533 RepID=UPI0015AC3A73|nr:uncharacterized protein K02A2.6-like [Stegodyphus dumicola]